jgi:integrase
MAKPRTPLIRTTKTKIDDLNARFRAARLHGVTAQATRHGRIVVYYRRALGDPKVRLRADPLSPAFFAEYADVREGRTLAAPVTPSPRRPATGSGTLRWMIEGYYGSTDYLAKKQRTRHVEKLLLDHVCEEPIAPGNPVCFGALPFCDFKTKAVRIVQERKISKESVTIIDEETNEEREVEVLRGVEAGNSRVKSLRSVFEYTKEHHDAEVNYAKQVRYRQSSNPNGFHTWIEAEIETYEAAYPVGTKQRLALALLLYGGPRRGDLVRLGPGMRKLLNGREFFVYRQEKNRDHNPVTAYIPVVPALRAVLDATPTKGLSFLSWGAGRPYSKESFGNLFRDWCRKAGLPAGCSMHGLRKACGSHDQGRLFSLRDHECQRPSDDEGD